MTGVQTCALPIYVDERGGQALDARVDREAEADRVARRGVRILADDQYPHVGERLFEGAQHLVARGQVALARGDLLAQEHAYPRDLVLDRGERFRPARFHDVAQRLSHVQKIAQATDKLGAYRRERGKCCVREILRAPGSTLPGARG